MTRQRWLLLALSVVWLGMILACGTPKRTTSPEEKIKAARAVADANLEPVRKAEAEAEADVARKAEATRKAEDELKAGVGTLTGGRRTREWVEALHKVEAARKAEAEAKAEAARKADATRKAEAEAKAEVARVEAEARAEAARKAEAEKVIPYRVLEREKLRDGTLRQVILVDEKASKADVVKLAESLWRKRESPMDLDVWDSEEMWKHLFVYADKTFTKEEWKRHWLGGVDKSSGGKFVWEAEGRDH
jgi:hypothetical protein